MKKNKVISLISAKGGSGKTIITTTLGKVLSEIGYNVLMIDGDAATNGLSLFYIDEIVEKNSNNANSFRGIFDSNYFCHDKMFLNLGESFKLLPATYTFKNTIEVDSEEYGKRISKTLEFCQKKKLFDFILIDNQAGSEYYTEFVISRSISDSVIIVSEYDPISAAGIERLKGFFHKDLSYDRTWTLLNKVLPEFADENNSFLEISKFLPPIVWNADVVKSYAKKQILLDFKYGNKFTLSVIRVVKSLLGKSIESDLAEWLKDKEQLIKNPIFDEYSKLKNQLVEYESQTKNKVAWKNVTFISAFASMMTIAIYFVRKYNAEINTEDTFGYIAPILMIFISVLFFARSTLRDMNFDKYSVEKKAIKKRIEQLEILKQQSLEKLLEGEIKSAHNKW